MARAFVAVGSNIDPEDNIRRAVRLLARRTRIVAVSTFYRSSPVGPPGQPAFVNGVVEIETDLHPLELKRTVLRRLEACMGRVRTEDKYAPRVIDLDLVIYGDRTADTPELTLPDPQIRTRPFLAVPLAELAPDLPLPGDGRAMRELAAAFGDHEMGPLVDYTRELKESLRDGPREGEAPG